MPVSKDSTMGSFAFAAVLAAVLGLLVSATANILAPRIATNREVERKKHVLMTTRLIDPGGRSSREKLEALYATRIVEKSLPIAETEQPLFLAVDDHGDTIAQCIPLEGRGLWGPIRGYLSLDAGGRRVLRITFYEHRETPGLGAEISSRRWADQWSGKSIIDDRGQLMSVVVKKGRIDPANTWESAHAVDGISGATITSVAVEQIVRAGLQRYQPYLEELWRNP